MVHVYQGDLEFRGVCNVTMVVCDFSLTRCVAAWWWSSFKWSCVELLIQCPPHTRYFVDAGNIQGCRLRFACFVPHRTERFVRGHRFRPDLQCVGIPCQKSPSHCPLIFMLVYCCDIQNLL